MTSGLSPILTRQNDKDGSLQLYFLYCKFTSLIFILTQNAQVEFAQVAFAFVVT